MMTPEQLLEFLSGRFSINVNQKAQPLDVPNTTRDTLAQLFAELGFTIGAEVGVEKGIYSEVLLKANPKLRLFSIDAWTAYEGYRDHVTQEECDELYAEALERLEKYECKVIKGFSMDIVKQFKDESLDFVYLDGNHEFQQVVNDVAEWSKKVRPGGIVAGHDYIKRKNAQFLMQVPYAINAYCDAYEIKPLMILGRKDAKSNLNPDKGELRDSTRSWFFVKPEKKPIIPGHNQPY